MIEGNDFLEMLFDEYFDVKENQKFKLLNFFGSNEKKILLLVDFEAEMTEKPEFVLLNDIITKGLGLNLNELALLNIKQNDEITLTEIVERLNSEKVIIWGCEEYLKSNNLTISNHESHFDDGVMYLKALRLNEYLKFPDMKKILWNSLKSSFH